jgi:tRNA-dihydrouridine synthase A
MVAANSIAHERADALDNVNGSTDTYDDAYLRRFLGQAVHVPPMEGASVLQLGGSDPVQMYTAAQTVLEMTQRGHCDYTAINLNCGCPSPKVAGKGCFGAALMEDPELVVQLTQAIHEGSQGRVPVTVKCRIGTDADCQPFTVQNYAAMEEATEYDKLARFVDTVASAGVVTDFTIHARIAVLGKSFSPADNRKVPPLKYHYVSKLVQDFPQLTFSLNGGIQTLPQVMEQLETTPNLAGVMIGRAWTSDPWRFAMTDRLVYGDDDTARQYTTRRQILEAYGHHADAEEEHGDPVKIRRFIVKAISSLFTGEPRAKKFRIAMDEIAGLPKLLHKQGKTMEGQPKLSQLIMEAAVTHLSDETLDRTPEESYERVYSVSTDTTSVDPESYSGSTTSLSSTASRDTTGDSQSYTCMRPVAVGWMPANKKPVLGGSQRTTTRLSYSPIETEIEAAVKETGITNTLRPGNTTAFRFALSDARDRIYPRVLSQFRSFASKNKKNKKKNKNHNQHNNLSKAARKAARRKREQREREARFHKDRIAKLRRQKNLHPAAKMKRVLSAADWWFSSANLPNDSFMKEQLRLHEGYIPLSVLLTFPKFHYWTDLELLYEAFTNPAAKKRYQVIIDKKLIDRAKATEERRRRENAEREKLMKERRMQADIRMEEREILFEARLYELIEQKRPEALKIMNEDIAKERAEIIADRRAEIAKDTNSLRGFMERQRDRSVIASYILDQWEKSENVEEKWGLPPFYDIEDVDDSDVLDIFYDLNSEVQEYLDSLDELSDSDDEFDEFDEFDEIEIDKENEYGTRLLGEEENLVSDDDDDDDDNEASNDIQYALVRHRRVSLDSLVSLEEFDDDPELEEDIFDDFSELEEIDKNDEKKGPSKKETVEKNKKSKNYKRYQSNRNILLISNTKKLENFCKILINDIEKFKTLHKDNPNASAIGFDVEYATLELDIRGTLPAMIQLASPISNSATGLIWLDKFPDHGRGMLSDESAQPLLKILSDGSILKVGVGATTDAKHLASWWGIDDKNYIGDYISGVVELSDEMEEDSVDEQKGLVAFSEKILGRTLPKRKQYKSGRQKKLKKQGKRHRTAHWRVQPDQITNDMKKYAANDAGCAIDIWLTMKELAKDAKS